MPDTNIIGDTCKDRRIDYKLIDKLNKECEAKTRKRELETRLTEKKNKKEEPITEPTIPQDINYIKTPDELREIKGDYSLQEGSYEINFDIYVQQGCKLILEPGVKLYFAKNTGITCEGRFEARGENGLEVLITAKDRGDGWKNLHLTGGAEAVLDYAKFSYGRGRADKYRDICGGAVSLFPGLTDGLKPSITINNSYFKQNSAKFGGALYNLNGNVKINMNNRFKENSAKENGGAIYNEKANLEVNKNNIFEKNFAMDGGGIYLQEGEIIIKNKNIFEHNHVRVKGGAIYNENGDIKIEKNNIFKNNYAKQNGGAIRNYKGNTKIKENNRFENNSAGLSGGAISNYQGILNGGKLEIDNSKNIFKDNTPEDIDT